MNEDLIFKIVAVAWPSGFFVARYIMRRIDKREFPGQVNTWVTYIFSNLICLGSWLTVGVFCMFIVIDRLAE